MQNDTPVDKSTQPRTGRVTAKLPADVHREMKIEAAHLGTEMFDLIRDSWDAYKAANPQPWRPLTAKKRQVA